MAADDLRVPRTCFDSRTPRDRRDTNATFSNRALGAAERGVSRVRINVLPCAIIARPEHIRILIEAERAYLIHYAADARVVLDHRIGEFALRGGLMFELGSRHVRLMHLHEIDAHEKWRRRVNVALKIVERRLLDILVKEGNADETLVRCVDVLSVDLEVLVGCLTSIG